MDIWSSLEFNGGQQYTLLPAPLYPTAYYAGCEGEDIKGKLMSSPLWLSLVNLMSALWLLILIFLVYVLLVQLRLVVVPEGAAEF